MTVTTATSAIFTNSESLEASRALLLSFFHSRERGFSPELCSTTH
jgi:hypothetical protein